MGLAAPGSAVLVEWSNAGEGGDLLLADRAQLGELGDEDGGGGYADAGNGGEQLCAS